MINRCENPKNKSFADYGARGVSVCKRWRSSFESFLADMGERPSPVHSLDRVDNDGDYAPGNCRWSTRSEQNRNRRNTAWLTIDGETLRIEEWAERAGVKRATIYKRRQRGWPDRESVFGR